MMKGRSQFFFFLFGGLLACGADDLDSVDVTGLWTGVQPPYEVELNLTQASDGSVSGTGTGWYNSAGQRIGMALEITGQVEPPRISLEALVAQSGRAYFEGRFTTRSRIEGTLTWLDGTRRDIRLERTR